MRSYRLKLDGVPLPLGDPFSGRFVVATRDFKFKLAQDNVLGIERPGGRASAYGEGFGFRHIEPGSHSIRSRLVFGDGRTFIQRYRIAVRGEEARRVQPAGRSERRLRLSKPVGQLHDELERQP